MSHPDALPATDRPLEISAQTFAQLRGALIRALRVSADAREPLCDALEIVETIQQQLDLPKPVTQPYRTARPRSKAQQYEIQDTPEGQFLVERRGTRGDAGESGGSESQPFRCPRASYDAAAKVLAQATDALHFDELMERLATMTGERQPDYRLRVSLRFWFHTQLVDRFRTRYTAVERERFEELARQAWETLVTSAARSRVA